VGKGGRAGGPGRKEENRGMFSKGRKGKEPPIVRKSWWGDEGSKHLKMGEKRKNRGVWLEPL